ncbi:MAG: amino acid ABC transporter permease [Lachnospiraceae bacterium]|nr:amino acid ABC transporter permease [Lachnospiraceae bacterium]
MGNIEKILLWLPQLLNGAKMTIIITIVSVFIGLIISLFLALGKMSKILVINKICSAYIFFFRGTPLLMQIYFLYFGLPQFNPALTIKSPFLAAVIAYVLNTAAYLAENIRAGIESIDKGQYEAAKTLGMTYAQTMRLIIIPQTVRRLIPPVGNEFIMVLKDVSLVAIIGLSDLTKVTRAISSSSATALVYIPAMIIYLIITAVFTIVFNKLEKRYSVYQ